MTWHILINPLCHSSCFVPTIIIC